MSVSKAVIVSKQFADDFNLVASYYNLTPQEVKEAKEAARNDLDSAIVCFASLALEATKDRAAA